MAIDDLGILSDPNPFVRWRALAASTARLPVDAATSLLELLRSERHPAVRIAAARALARHAQEDTVATLALQLFSSEPRFAEGWDQAGHRDAAMLLGLIGSPSAVQVLRDALRRGIYHAVHGLRLVASRYPVFEDIAGALHAETNAVRWSAAEAMGALPDPRSSALLIDAIRKEYPEDVRHETKLRMLVSIARLRDDTALSYVRSRWAVKSSLVHQMISNSGVPVSEKTDPKQIPILILAGYFLRYDTLAFDSDFLRFALEDNDRHRLLMDVIDSTIFGAIPKWKQVSLLWYAGSSGLRANMKPGECLKVFERAQQHLDLRRDVTEHSIVPDYHLLRYATLIASLNLTEARSVRTAVLEPNSRSSSMWDPDRLSRLLEQSLVLLWSCAKHLFAPDSLTTVQDSGEFVQFLDIVRNGRGWEPGGTLIKLFLDRISCGHPRVTTASAAVPSGKPPNVAVKQAEQELGMVLGGLMFAVNQKDKDKFITAFNEAVSHQVTCLDCGNRFKAVEGTKAIPIPGRGSGVLGARVACPSCGKELGIVG